MSHLDELLVVFGATTEDLQANRSGMLTPRQAGDARAATGEDASFMIVFAILFAALMYTVLAILIADGRFFDFADGVSIHHVIVMLVAGGSPTSALAWGVHTGWIHRRTRTMTHVQSCAGEIRKRRCSHGALSLYEVQIGRRRFDVSERAFTYLRDGDRYCLYFVPISRVVVLAEPLDP
jgi:hypothetical protein